MNADPTPAAGGLSEETLEQAVERRVRDWLRSTSETYLQPVGSDPWIRGLVGYIVRGPGALAARTEAADRAYLRGLEDGQRVGEARVKAAAADRIRAALSSADTKALDDLLDRERVKAWDEGSLAMRKARMVQGESLPPNPYRAAAVSPEGGDR